MAGTMLTDYLQRTFGRKLYKIALTTGFTCPNRDGAKGTGGCIFCSSRGAGEFAQSAALPVSEQIERGKLLVAQKMRKEANPGYIAYFQAFTGTYGDIAVQRKLFYEAIRHPDVAVLSIATRPDCLPQEVLSLLAELNSMKPVWVELGLQTANPKTGELINRRFDNSDFTEAVKNLKKIGVTVIAHQILGLPGETHEDERQTLDFILSHPIDGIKFHLLHVLKNTRLAQMDYTPLSLEEYTDRVADLILRLPENVVVHRMTGDGEKATLLAPLWSMDKKRVIGTIQKKIRAGQKTG